MEKVCRVCNETRPIERFHKKTDRPGYSNICKDCRNKKARTPEAQQVLKEQLRKQPDDYASTAVTLSEVTKSLVEVEELLMKVYQLWEGDIDSSLSSMDLLPEVIEYLHKNKLIS